MRILSRILFALSVGAAQAQTVPSMTIQLPGVVQPAQTITVNVPKNGGKVTFTIPQQTLLKPSQAATPVTPVTIPSYTFTLTLTPAQLSTLRTAIASGGGTITGVTVTLKAAQ